MLTGCNLGMFVHLPPGDSPASDLRPCLLWVAKDLHSALLCLSPALTFSEEQGTPGLVCARGLFGNLAVPVKPFSEHHKNI